MGFFSSRKTTELESDHYHVMTTMIEATSGTGVGGGNVGGRRFVRDNELDVIFRHFNIIKFIIKFLSFYLLHLDELLSFKMQKSKLHYFFVYCLRFLHLILLAKTSQQK